jgi:CrcB protein
MSSVQMLWVFVAGGVGSVMRWLVSLACLAAFGPIYPVGTLTVNTVGCYLLAALLELAISGDRVSPMVRVALASGFLGGFTTYSTFSHEAFTYFRDGALGLGFGYVGVTVLLCLAACLLGQLTARWFVGAA